MNFLKIVLVLRLEHGNIVSIEKIRIHNGVRTDKQAFGRTLFVMKYKKDDMLKYFYL